VQRAGRVVDAHAQVHAHALGLGLAPGPRPCLAQRAGEGHRAERRRVAIRAIAQGQQGGGGDRHRLRRGQHGHAVPVGPQRGAQAGVGAARDGELAGD